MQDRKNKYLTLRPTKDNPAFVFIALPKPCGKLTAQRIYIKHQPSLEQAWVVARNLRDRLGKQYWGEGWNILSSMMSGSMVNPIPKPLAKAATKTVGDIPPKRKLRHRQLCEVVPGVMEIFLNVPLGSPPIGRFKVDFEHSNGNLDFSSFRFGEDFPRLDALYAALKRKQEIERTKTGRKINGNN